MREALTALGRGCRLKAVTLVLTAATARRKADPARNKGAIAADRTLQD